MLPFIAFDVETAGLIPGHHALLSIGAARYAAAEAPQDPHEPRKIDTFHAYIVPEGEMDPESLVIAGYDEDLWHLEQEPLDRALERLLDWLRGWSFQPLAHNAGFDRAWLDEAQRAADTDFGMPYRWSCSQASFQFLMDAGHLPEGSASLDRLLNLAGLSRLPGPHRAHYDAALTLDAYHWLMKQVPPE